MSTDLPREEALFQGAAQRQGAEREAFLDAHCGTDQALRARLEALLAAHEAGDSFMEDVPGV